MFVDLSEARVVIGLGDGGVVDVVPVDEDLGDDAGEDGGAVDDGYGVVGAEGVGVEDAEACDGEGSVDDESLYDGVAAAVVGGDDEGDVVVADGLVGVSGVLVGGGVGAYGWRVPVGVSEVPAPLG
ncbi:MAG: hypothetical protein EBV05_13435, partial [Cyanobacteria bacterium WB6_1B_304]|nr:hypothetical protein [Cyanobacteria bacterium WB6_1B_304]